MKQVWPGDDAVTFEAERLADATSFDPEQRIEGVSGNRWTELRLYRTPDGTYLVAGTGCSTVEGESDRHWLNVQRRARDVVKALTRRDRRSGRQYLTDVALDLLDMAGEEDPEIFDEVTAFQTVRDWNA